MRITGTRLAMLQTMLTYGPHRPTLAQWFTIYLARFVSLFTWK